MIGDLRFEICDRETKAESAIRENILGEATQSPVARPAANRQSQIANRSLLHGSA